MLPWQVWRALDLPSVATFHATLPATTGLDPETRRQLWNILQDCKKDKNRAMVLTTHSMEEADVLCNRIGIVNDGVLRCLGS